MVSINLLPEEFRRRERTPIRIFVATLAACIVVVGLGATLGYFRFGQLVTAEDTVARLGEDRAALEPQLKHHAALTSEIGESEKWHQAIRELRNSRITWTTKLDQLVELVSQRGDQDRYLTWFTELIVQQTLDAKASGGTVSAKGLSNEADFAKVAMFFADIKKDPFFEEFSGLSTPEGKVVEGDQEAIEFPLTLTIAPRDPKKSASGEPTKAAESGDGK